MPGEADPLGLAMRLGLLPSVPHADGEEDIVEGLEPVFDLAPAAVYWRAHVGWFRWFASGDVSLLMLLLLLKELK